MLKNERNILGVVLTAVLAGGYILFEQNRTRKIRINWTYPKRIEEVLNSDISKGQGVYCLTTGARKQDDILYIGMTNVSFNERLRDHSKKLLKNVESDVFVRMGEVKLSSRKRRKMLREIESALIYEHETLLNISQTNGYTYFNKIRVINDGFRGPLNKEVVVSRE